MKTTENQGLLKRFLSDIQISRLCGPRAVRSAVLPVQIGVSSTMKLESSLSNPQKNSK